MLGPFEARQLRDVDGQSSKGWAVVELSESEVVTQSW